MQWVEQNNGEYTIDLDSMVCRGKLVASLKLKHGQRRLSPRYTGYNRVQRQNSIHDYHGQNDIYIAGDSITVTVVLKDAQGNFITDGVVQLNEENVKVRNADPIQAIIGFTTAMGNIKRQYMAHFAEANLNAQLKMVGWSDANYSNNYTIKPGEVSPLGSQLRIREDFGCWGRIYLSVFY